ncbi:MAG: hypothetical protein IT368_06230 [Candidatus Hydrogenedentes bacterium]|nr:hypothetical protein [Candidatus Hydrogenedentota bacterium]
MRQSNFSKFRWAALCLALLTIPGIAFAQADTVTYQGVLRDAAGEPVADGNYAMSFAIFDAESGGTLLWSEGQAAVPVAGGSFSVELGTFGTFGTFFQDHANTQLWLEVSADTGSGLEAFLPRVAVSRVPYASQAEAAAAAGSVPWAGITGVPAGFADGTDNVDGGAAASVPWAGVTGKPAGFADGIDNVDGGAAASVPWAGITSVPADLADGDDVDGGAAASVPWAGILGIPSDIADGDDVDGGAAASVPWAGITGVPAGFADGTDNVDGGTAAAVPWAGVSGKPAGFADGVDDVDGGDADTVDGQHASAFAPTVHNHSASQITSGTINYALLPVGNLSGQVAAGDHTHSANQIVSGVFPVSMLPVGTTTGTVAAGNHTHSVSDYFIGSLNAELSGTKTMAQSTTSGISLSNGNTRLTVSTAGLYFVSAPAVIALEWRRRVLFQSEFERRDGHLCV